MTADAQYPAAASGISGSSTEVAVIGSGIGGLSTAAYLADAGMDVTVFEQNEQLGGRASVLEADGFTFDMGPSWYLMPDVFERFFDDFGQSPEDYYDLTRLDPHYRIFWKDGDRMDLVPELETNKEQFDAYESGAGETLDRYLERSKEHYEVGMEQFVYEDRDTWRSFLDLDVFRHARGLKLLGSMDDYVAEYFDHPKLRQVMQYSLVFLGGAPSKTPALYNLMSHVDFNLGVYYPQGGFGSVVDGIAELGAAHGVEYRTNAPVDRITRNGSDLAVTIQNADRHTADVVVSNADYAHTELALLSEEHRQYEPNYWESRTYAPSAYLLYLGVEGDIDPLAHHSLVLPTDWSTHFAEIFDRPTWPTDPAYYLCAPSQTDDEVAPDGHASLFALVPIAPGLDDTPANRSAMRSQLLEDIAANTGVELADRIVFENSFCIDDFANRYNSYNGTALGLAHTLRQTALFRPNRRSSALEGLYYTGSYTTPGIGVPMCLISGMHTARAVRTDR